MHFLLITDAGDPRIADYRNIPDPELARRGGVFVAEGRFVVRRLLEASGFVTRSILVTEAARHALEDALAGAPDVAAYVVPQQLMDEVTGFHVHRGCLAIGERPPERPWRQTVAAARTILALERVANADNVGGIFRSAAAFGADAILLDPASTDPLYRKAIRTSMGATLAVPFARMEPWPAALSWLSAHGFATVALTADASARPIRDTARALKGRPAALVLGHEGEGLSPAALAACEHRSRVPIAPAVDSLNVAVAAAIALHEWRTTTDA